MLVGFEDADPRLSPIFLEAGRLRLYHVEERGGGQVHKEIRVAVFPKEVDFFAATTLNLSVPGVCTNNVGNNLS